MVLEKAILHFMSVLTRADNTASLVDIYRYKIIEMPSLFLSPLPTRQVLFAE